MTWSVGDCIDDPVTVDTVFERATAGLPSWVGDRGGSRELVPVGRWLGGHRSTDADRACDLAMIEQCTGPTMDMGCGPGRLTEALTVRGVSALGVDNSAAAVALTVRRGATAIRRDIFGELPGEGTWSHVLLADGNIGIGGEPRRVLERARALLSPTGDVTAEVQKPSRSGIAVASRRWETDEMVGRWFSWATVDLNSMPDLAHATGFRVRDVVDIEGRFFVRLTRTR